MSRVAIPITVVDGSGNAVQGASVVARRRSDNALATWYAAETGGGGSTAALATDAKGRVTAWVDRGAYKLTISGPVAPYDEMFDAAPASDASVDGQWLSGSVMPVGAMMPYGGPSDPAGGNWLICDGRAISRASYAALFNAIGATFGPGNGSTTFNLPDTRGRMLVGAGQGSGLTNRALAGTGGEESHTLTAPEMPTHTHGLVGGGQALTSGGAGAPNLTTGGGAYGSGAIDTAGGGNSHNNMPPFLAVNHIIRAQ
jgi:microcystin-dependent protein